MYSITDSTRLVKHFFFSFLKKYANFIYIRSKLHRWGLEAERTIYFNCNQHIIKLTITSYL